MPRAAASILSACLLIACSRDEAPRAAASIDGGARALADAIAAAPPVLVIDAAHDHGASSTAASYTVRPTSSLVLDPAAHALALSPPAPAHGVDVVHVSSSTEQYVARWDGRGKLTLSPDTLRGEDDGGAFPGFEAGQKYVIGVGAEAPRDGGKDFYVAWVTVVRVEGR